MATKEEILAAIETIKTELLEAKKELQDAGGFLGKLKVLMHLAPEAVDQVEAISAKLGLRGADKKQLAIDALLAVVALPWWLPEAAVRAMLGVLVDSLVGLINKRIK